MFIKIIIKSSVIFCNKNTSANDVTNDITKEFKHGISDGKRKQPSNDVRQRGCKWGLKRGCKRS